VPESNLEAVPAVSDSTTKDVRISSKNSFPLKRCWSVGTRIVIVIDDSIVQKLKTDDTYVKQEITKEGILLKITRIGDVFG
jgi:hypothetical protein